jgi:hypothetical protein
MKRKAPAGQHLPQGIRDRALAEWRLICTDRCQAHARRHQRGRFSASRRQCGRSRASSHGDRSQRSADFPRFALDSRRACVRLALPCTTAGSSRGPASKCCCHGARTWAASQMAAHYQTTLSPLGLVDNSQWGGLRDPSLSL